MFKRHLSRTVLLGLGLLMAACAQQQVKTVSGSDQLQLAKQLLNQTVYINTLFTECTSLGNDTELQAISLQQDWLQKNWPLVAAADNYYADQQRPSGLLYDGQLLSLEATWLAHQARQKAIQELNFDQRTYANKVQTCSARLQTLANQEMDLATLLPRKTQAFDTTAEENTPIQIDRVPELAFQGADTHSQGRSWFPLETQFKSECAQPQKLVLLNDWPKETYAVYCDGRPLALVVCDWGECQRKTE